MSTIMSVMVENHSGVLSRIAGLFARRGFNIASLSVGETEDPQVSRMTIVVEGDERQVEQVGKQLNKQIDVIGVRALSPDAATRRELLLVKVGAAPQTRRELIDIAGIMNCKTVDLSPAALTLELCDSPEKVQELLGLLEPYGILETARTGTVALPRCINNF